MTTKTNAREKAERNRAIAGRIRAAIEASGKSMRELAAGSGLAQQTFSSAIASLEAGRSTTLDTLEKIAGAVGRSVSELLGEASAVEPWPELDAVLLYHPDRWHPDTIAAFRHLAAYKGKGRSPQEIEKALDELDEVVRQVLDGRDRATRQSRKK